MADVTVSVVIPARLESSRLPGKVLLDVGGKPMLQHVWERARRMAETAEIVIATDADEVRECAVGWGADVRMTAKNCPNGTARAASLLDGLSGDFIINLQGDEPLMEPALLDALVATWREFGGDMVTAVRLLDDAEELFNPNVVKVVRGLEARALMFSRATIPHVRDCRPGDWLTRQRYWAHIGVYGFARETLAQYAVWPVGELETVEKLEQLRFLEQGCTIRVVETDYRPVGVDTAEDLERVRRLIAQA